MSARDVVSEIREAAREYGYAVGVHGSQRRDLDLIAAPWTVEAVDPIRFVDLLCQRVGLHPRVANLYPDGRTMPNPEFRPFGRIGWSLVSMSGPFGYEYIDLSVMPKAGSAFPIEVAYGYAAVAVATASSDGNGS